MKRLHSRLRILIAQHEGLNQTKLAQRTGLSTTTINKLFNNKLSRIDANTIEILCDFFNCSIQDLLELREP